MNARIAILLLMLAAFVSHGQQSTLGSGAIANTIFTTPARLSADLAAATAGKTMVCTPGYYNTNNLWKPGVNWLWLPGAIVDYKCTDTNSAVAAYAIYDDRGYGGVARTSSVVHMDVIKVNTGTNGIYDTLESGYVGNPNWLGFVLTTTNRGSLMNLKAQDVAVIHVGSAASAFYTKSCSPFTRMEVGIIRPQTNTVALFDTGLTADADVSVGFYGYYWNGVTNYFKADRIDTGAGFYALWGDQSAAGAANGNADVWIDVDQISYGNIYISAISNEFRTWIVAKEVSSAISPITLFGSGKTYIYAQKVEARPGAQYCLETAPLSGISNAINYITCQKFTANDAFGWINSPCGTNYINVQEYNTVGPFKAGDLMIVNAGKTVINGGVAVSTNRIILRHDPRGTAVTVLQNFLANNKLTSGTNPPILINGNGLQIHGGSYVGPTMTNTITAPASMTNTVGIYGHVMANSTNRFEKVATSPLGVFTSDANVQ